MPFVRVAVIRKYIFILIGLLFPLNVYADTLLLGWDPANPYSGNYTTCWDPASGTIEGGDWKAERVQAKANGTISYFQMRCPITPTGCTNDAGCWAVYEAGTSSSVGTLKAYTCFTGYNWTTIGLGQHQWDVVTTVTNLNITAGQYYWIVYYSTACDSVQYAGAGCSAFIPAYRGKNVTACIEDGLLDDSAYPSHSVGDYYSYPPPPANTSMTTGTATYQMWSVWASEETPEPVPTAMSGVTILGGSIR